MDARCRFSSPDGALVLAHLTQFVDGFAAQRGCRVLGFERKFFCSRSEQQLFKLLPLPHELVLQNNGLFVSFPYVCPEPVLVKRKF